MCVCVCVARITAQAILNQTVGAVAESMLNNGNGVTVRSVSGL